MRTVVVTLRVPKGLEESIVKIVEESEEYCTRSDFIIDAIRRHIELKRKEAAIAKELANHGSFKIDKLDD